MVKTKKFDGSKIVFIRKPIHRIINLVFQKILRRNDNQSYVERINKNPLNANLHFQYAKYASKKMMPYLAYAELKTAEYLGTDRKKVEKYNTMYRNALPKLIEMNHNQYFRFNSLSSEILLRGGNSDISILDVGGGNGELASFIPEASYCLVDPSVNGISGKNLPFPDHSFDYVVSCHVLEHIPMEERKLFLDQLLSKAKRGIILLNPFHIENTHVDERLELIHEITGALWAQEHLDCTLPKVEDIKKYANERRLSIHVKPNGTMTTSLAFVFLDYFATKSGRIHDWKKINFLFNNKFIDSLDSLELPNAYIIYLGYPKERK